VSKGFCAYQRRSDEWPGGEYRDDQQANWVARAAAPEEDTGTPGAGATAASLASDDPNCPDGGAPVTDGNGYTAHACTGATGPAGPCGSASTDSGLPEVTVSSSNGYTRAEGNTAGPRTAVCGT
jgi:hypothetical protein